MSYRGDWYLLRAKFTNDSNFLGLEIGRGRGAEERYIMPEKVYSLLVRPMACTKDIMRLG